MKLVVNMIMGSMMGGSPWVGGPPWIMGSPWAREGIGGPESLLARGSVSSVCRALTAG